MGPIVTPDTLLWWYRKPIAQKYDGSSARKVGRPRTAKNIEQMVIWMARENPTWGYTRIRGALRNLGHEIGRTTSKRILAANGIESATTRREGMTWETFLKMHWGAIAAPDFFTVEALTRTGLVRFLVFFMMDLTSRVAKIAGIAPDPDGRWMKQTARDLTDTEYGFLFGARYLIHDGPALHRQVSSNSTVGRHGDGKAPGAEPRSERLRRAVRALDPGGVPVARDSVGRVSPPPGDRGVREALPSGEEPSGA
jgi:hypothetical protein